uniref:Uncharacterized protein n=1 Tax=Anguilla anguilla TaxID=7936 RepID=A0A0E9XT29_ANGAN
MYVSANLFWEVTLSGHGTCLSVYQMGSERAVEFSGVFLAWCWIWERGVDFERVAIFILSSAAVSYCHVLKKLSNYYYFLRLYLSCYQYETFSLI